jgi:NADP-dependent alcohol dehydrogenase
VEFFRSLGMPTRLSDYGVDPKEAAPRVRARLEERGAALGEHGDLTPDRAEQVLLAAE